VHARVKFIIAAAVVLGSAGWLMASSIRETGMYYLTPGELASKVASDSTFYETGVKMGARVVPGSIVRQTGGRDIQFRVTDGAQDFAVSFRGIAPDTFTDGVDVVLEGRLSRDGTFHATTLLAKCASRYENAPEGYRSSQPAPVARANP
jgi:cytochrome c-type biogenesis protein CcmE